MTTEQLSAEEANKLFTEVSKAVQSGDGQALSDALAQETLEEEHLEDSDSPEEDTSAQGDEEEQEDNEESAEEADEEKEEEEEQDPISVLKAEIAALKKEQEKAKSQMGRVSSIQSRLAKLDQQLKERTSSTSGQISEKVEPKIRAALKDLEDTDPALANAVAAAIKEALTTVESESNAQFSEHIKTLRDIDYDDYLEQQKEILLTKYPNAPQVFASDAWKTWKREAPEHIRSLASSDNAEAMLMALDIYKQDMLKKYPDLANAQGANAKSVQSSEVNEEAQRIEAERNKRKKTAANVNGGKPPNTTAKTLSDPEALFKKAMEEARKRARGEI